ncbi:MAG: efflux RND transporter periplasmic adaptor subunit [Pseudomonadaceae bacterium]|nr:efflux RND transporter periplasmic adaptor subunit [Pseudomonadaceae bacterium]
MKTMLILLALSWTIFHLPNALAAQDEHDHGAETHENHEDDHGDHIDDEPEDHSDDHDDEHGDDHEEQAATSIGADHARLSGIATAVAGSGELSRTVKTYGRVAVPPNQISHIRARFPGLVKTVSVDIGDVVNAGDHLARIEANTSLKSYTISAPIKGIVTQRHANAGELAQDQVLFSIVDPNQLWAELRIFEGQLADIRTSQPLTLSSATQETTSKIENIMPSLDGHPFVIARAKIDNKAGIWSPGMFVEGDIVVDTFSASLVVDNRALQTLDGARGVFTQDGERYEFHPIQLGRSDGDFTEVLGGLEPGSTYVVENSYLIKADIEKSGAAHEH